MKKTVSLLLTFMLIITMTAVAILPAGAASDDFTYKVTDGKVEITSYTGSDSALTVPAEIEGLPVTSIGDEAFYQNKKIESVTIPDSVESIGNKAFAGSYVKSVTMADSVTSLGNAAFKDCIYLTDVTLSGRLTAIRNNTFAFCTRLESVVIPEGVTLVETSAFQSCNHLASITFPSSLEVIGEYAFAYTAITEFNAPENLEKIMSYAFFICDKLTSLTLSDNVKVIEAWAFANNTALKEVTLNEGLEVIGDSAFDTCALKEIAVPSTVTSIGQFAIGYTYDEEIFDYVYNKDFVVKCEAGSAAAMYAQDNGFEVAPLIDPTEPPTLPEDKFELGDVNMDKTVNIRDATAIQKFIVNLISLSDEAQALADYDGDLRISVRDATAIQKFIVGL